MATTPNSVITPQTPNVGVGGVVLTSAMTATKQFDGTETAGTAMAVIFNAHATNGSKLDTVVVKLSGTAGTTPSGITNNTVLRVWLNNGSTNLTAANNVLLAEIAIPSSTYSTTIANTGWALPVGRAIPAGYKVYAGLTVAIGGTNAGLAVNGLGGDF